MYFEEGVITINNKNILENITTDNNRLKQNLQNGLES